MGDAEGGDLAGKISSELRDILMISIQNGYAISRQRLDQLIFRAGDFFNGSKELKMNGSDAGDNSNVRLCDAGQFSNFATMGHTHLNDGDIMLRLKAQHGKRQSEVV